MDINEICKLTAAKGASDLHFATGLPPIMRVNGRLEKVEAQPCTSEEITQMLEGIFPEGKKKINPAEESDFAIQVGGIARFRVNVYHDRKGVCVALRFIPNKIRALGELGFPASVAQICGLHKGLVLVTGATGSGKSTTLAAMIDKINSDRNGHIITIEDPIEFLHENKKCLVNQREIGEHTKSFAVALRAALREDPNVILVGELRDLDTISMAVTAAETGHLVLATLHSNSATDTINRVIDVFPSHQQEQIRVQLAESLAAVISQVLVASIDGAKRYIACEVMMVNPSIKNHIREKKTHQIGNAITMAQKEGMQTLDQSLKVLMEEGKISRKVAQQWAIDKKYFDLPQDVGEGEEI